METNTGETAPGAGGGSGAAGAVSKAGASGAGGLGGSQGAAGAAGSVDASVCGPACEVAASCFSNMFSIPACEAQCAKEFAGAGWLHPDVVGPFFSALAAHGPDPKCELLHTEYGWGDYEPSFVVPNTKLLNDCAEATLHLCGEVGQTKVNFYETCFYSMYRYNDAIRSQVLECLKQPTCENASECLNKIDLGGNNLRPWFGQVIP